MKTIKRSELEEMDIYELLEEINFDMTKVMNEDDYDELMAQEIYEHNYSTVYELLENVGYECYIYDTNENDLPQPIEDIYDLINYLKNNYFTIIEDYDEEDEEDDE